MTHNLLVKADLYEQTTPLSPHGLQKVLIYMSLHRLTNYPAFTPWVTMFCRYVIPQISKLPCFLLHKANPLYTPTFQLLLDPLMPLHGSHNSTTIPVECSPAIHTFQQRPWSETDVEMNFSSQRMWLSPRTHDNGLSSAIMIIRHLMLQNTNTYTYLFRASVFASSLKRLTIMLVLVSKWWM